MPGKNYIKVTSILFAIGAVLSLVIYSIAGLLLGYATVDTGEKTGWVFVVMCMFYTVLSVLQLVASVKGIKNCNIRSAAPVLKKWGYLLIVIALISGIFNFINSVLSGQPVVASAIGIIIGLLLPILYVYGASLNQKA